MKIENNTLILDTNDVNHYIVYNSDKLTMFRNFKEKLSKNIKLSSFKNIVIPANISFQNIPQEFSSRKDLIDTLYSYGENLFPYNGFEINNLSLNQFNSIIEEYLINNLNLNISCSDEFSYHGRSLSVNVDLSLNDKIISSKSDYFTLSD